MACREVWEEVGLDLKSCEFELVGKLPDLRLDTRNRTMNVACLVYYLPPGKAIPPLNCDPKEVRAAGWAPLNELAHDKVYAKKMTLEYMAQGFAEKSQDALAISHTFGAQTGPATKQHP